MKKQYSILLLIAAVVALWLLWPKFKSGFAWLRSFAGGRDSIVTGTASKGDDSGGVLTNVNGGIS